LESVIWHLESPSAPLRGADGLSHLPNRFRVVGRFKNSRA